VSLFTDQRKLPDRLLHLLSIVIYHSAPLSYLSSLLLLLTLLTFPLVDYNLGITAVDLLAPRCVWTDG